MPDNAGPWLIVFLRDYLPLLQSIGSLSLTARAYPLKWLVWLPRHATAIRPSLKCLKCLKCSSLDLTELRIRGRVSKLWKLKYHKIHFQRNSREGGEVDFCFIFSHLKREFAKKWLLLLFRVKMSEVKPRATFFRLIRSLRSWSSQSLFIKEH